MRSALQLTAVLVILAISGTAQDITQKNADSLLNALSRAIPVNDRI